MIKTLCLLVLFIAAGFCSVTGFAPAAHRLKHVEYDAVLSQQQNVLLLKMVGDAEGIYYGESGGSYMVKEFSLYEELEGERWNTVHNIKNCLVFSHFSYLLSSDFACLFQKRNRPISESSHARTTRRNRVCRCV
jgi:hypothetical protein